MTDVAECTQAIAALRAHWQRSGLSLRAYAEQFGDDVPLGTLYYWFHGGTRPVHRRRAALLRMHRTLCGVDADGAADRAIDAAACRRAQNLRKLLTIVGDELAWFVRACPRAREALRRELQPLTDLGFLGSLLTMIGSERSLAVWKSNETAFTRFSGTPHDGGNQR